MLFLPSIFVLLFVKVVLSKIEANVEHTVQYDAETFVEELPKRNHFVMFYAPWCGHCHKLAPTWEKLAEMLNEEDTIRIAKVDCTVEKTVCSEQDVTGYPTLKFFRIGDNEGVKFKGTRDLPSLTNFINEQLRTAEELDGFNKNLPEAMTGLIELTDASYENALAQGKYFVKFYAPWCGHCQKLAPVWDELGKLYQHGVDLSIAKIDCTQNRDACNSFNIKGYPTLLWLENGKQIDKYKGQRTLEDLKSFVDKMLVSTPSTEEVLTATASDIKSTNTVAILNGDTFQQVIENGIAFVKFFAPWCSHCKRLAPIWEDLSKRFVGNNDVQIVKVDCTLDDNKQLCTNEEVDGFPTVFLYKNGKKISEYSGNRSLDDLYDFVQKHISEHDEL